MTECVVCKRISAKDVLKWAHIVFCDSSRVQRRELGLESIRLINAVDNCNRFFFCGKNKFGLVGGLFYLLGKRLPIKLSQREIAAIFSVNPATISAYYRRWIKVFKEYPTLNYIEE